MDINAYTSYALKNKTVSAVIVAVNADDAQKLLQFHIKKVAKQIRLPDGILPDEKEFLPMPDLVMSRLYQKNCGCPVVLTGLCPYLTLLNEGQRKTLLNSLKNWVDDTKLNVTIILSARWKNDIKEVFDHPRYEGSKKLIYLQGGPTNFQAPNIVLVEQEWIKIKPPVFDTFIDYLQKSSDFPTEQTESITIAMPLSKNLAGLNPSIEQIWTLSDFMRKFYGISEPLNDSVLWFILKKAQELGINNGLECICALYGDRQDVLRTAPKRINSIQNVDEASAMLWMLKKSISEGSYLYDVLSLQNCSADNFLQYYIVNGAVNRIRDKNAKCLTAERKAALKEIAPSAISPHIVNFINSTRNEPIQYVAEWLNNDTKEEHAELVRRCHTENITDNVPQQIFAIYPVLGKYLAEFDYGTTELSDYFKRYRKQKVWNIVTEEFCKQAFDAIMPTSVASRASVLQPYFKDGKTVLLVVDAMGAEYLPLLCAFAVDYGIMAIKSWITSVTLPSSTPFNKIEWNNELRLPDIKLLDEIVHNGAESPQSDYAENLVKVLDEIIPHIFAKITEALNRFDQVLLTADHGASRLAVLANDLKLSQTLPNPNTEPPADWRYCQKPRTGQCPPELTETLDGNRWVVRGYNRLSKQGGKYNELHGGATLEELLVPVILWQRRKTAHPIDIPKKPLKQLIEKDDFDI